MFSFCHSPINLRPYREDEWPKAARGDGDRSEREIGLLATKELSRVRILISEGTYDVMEIYGADEASHRTFTRQEPRDLGPGR